MKNLDHKHMVYKTTAIMRNKHDAVARLFSDEIPKSDYHVLSSGNEPDLDKQQPFKATGNSTLFKAPFASKKTDDDTLVVKLPVVLTKTTWCETSWTLWPQHKTVMNLVIKCETTFANVQRLLQRH